MKANWLFTLAIIGLVSSSFAISYAQEHSGMNMKSMEMGEHDQSTMQSMEKGASTSDKVHCAYDGMMMKKSAMMSMKHGEETLYFCNKEQMDAFQKSPKRYLKKVNIGRTPLLMNVLTMKEYKDVMENMGMGKMMKKPGANDTHWLSVYLAGEHEMELPGFAVKVVSPKGKTEFQELKLDKMMKTYTGNVSLLESGEYKLSLLMASPEITVP